MISIKDNNKMIDDNNKPMRATEVALRYLRGSPEGPYKDMVIGLVSLIEDAKATEDNLRGAIQDLKVEARGHQLKLTVFENGSFGVFSDEERWIDWFNDNFFGDPEEDLEDS